MKWIQGYLVPKRIDRLVAQILSAEDGKDR